MSVEAITWALSQKLERSSAKFVLVALANCANHDMTCWPSTQYLCDATCQDRKTVQKNIKALKDAGYIEDTQARKGQTGQVIAYQLKEPSAGLLNDPKNGPVKEAQKRTCTKNETGPKTDIKRPVFPAKEAQKRTETGPKTGHGTVRNRNRTVKNQNTARVALHVPDVPDSIFQDFEKLRKAKKAPLTQTAIDGIGREAALAGITLAEALAMCCERGWVGFKAAWLDRDRSRSPPSASAETAYQRSMRERVEQATGTRRQPTTPADVVDVKCTHLETAP